LSFEPTYFNEHGKEEKGRDLFKIQKLEKQSSQSDTAVTVLVNRITNIYEANQQSGLRNRKEREKLIQ